MPLKTKLILGTLGLAVLVMLVIFGHEPSSSAPRDSCRARGIDSEQLKEGACYYGDSKNVVVDWDHTVHLETLDAKLLGMRETSALSGPRGTKAAGGTFVTFDLEIRNRTAESQTVGENQAEGTVTFEVATGASEVIAREGNLDIGNFGVGGGDYEPEQLFSEPEIGVIRAYRKPKEPE